VYRAYASLADWESQTENTNITEPVEDDVNPAVDLVTAGTILNVACYADGADTSTPAISGWTTGAGNYIRIYTPVNSTEVGMSQRHTGTYSTSAYRLEPTNIASAVINVNAAHVRIDGIQMNFTTNAASRYGISFGATDDVAYELSNCIIRATADANDSTTGVYVGSNPTGGDIKIWNNIMYDFDETGDIAIRHNDAQSLMYVYNNTIYDATTGVDSAGAAYTYAKNNITQNVGNGFLDAFNAASTNNISDIAADAPGSNPRSCSVQFVDPGNDDFRLAGGDTCANDAGADLSADANLAFSDDIAGTTRTHWDTGAHEQTSGGTADGIPWNFDF
jgi:hypothetical protein